jgi:tetratricopeptide (TPR) repeat protein
LLAEKLLEDKKYDAAIIEFQTIVDREPFSDLGKSCLLKIAQIQHLYLGRAKDAEQSYAQLLKRTKDDALKAEIEEALANIAYENLEEYNVAIQRYQQILAREPGHQNAPKYLYNIGRGFFLSGKLVEAQTAFSTLINKYPLNEYSLKAELEQADILSAQKKYKEAIKGYEKIISKNNEKLSPLAKFSMAAAYEEMDDLDRAYEILNSIKDSYPMPKVVELKIKKMKRRKILRRR